jgi:hypothetical protein
MNYFIDKNNTIYIIIILYFLYKMNNDDDIRAADNNYRDTLINDDYLSDIYEEMKLSL